MSTKDFLKKIKDEDIEYVDVRFTDTRGKLQHVTIARSPRRSASSTKRRFSSRNWRSGVAWWSSNVLKECLGGMREI